MGTNKRKHMLLCCASELTLDSVSCLFGGTMVAAALHFGISVSSMQRVCRRLGIRWPRTNGLWGKRAFLARVPAAEQTPTQAVVRVFPKNSALAVDVTLDSLSSLFGGTQQAAAHQLGVSLWTMKKICRKLGTRWPSSDRRHQRWRGLARQEVDAAEQGGLPALHELVAGELGLLSGGDEGLGSIY